MRRIWREGSTGHQQRWRGTKRRVEVGALSAVVQGPATDMGVPPAPEAGGRSCGPALLAFFLVASRGLVAAFKVATPYSLYVCPEGQNVTLTCRLLASTVKERDVMFYKTWYRSSRSDMQVCSERWRIRNLTFQDLHVHHGGHQNASSSQELAKRHGLESVSDHHGNFSIIVQNLTLQDSGLYCCLVVELRHHHSEQRVHGAIELRVQPGEHYPDRSAWGGVTGVWGCPGGPTFAPTGQEAPSKCIAHPASPRDSENKKTKIQADAGPSSNASTPASQLAQFPSRNMGMGPDLGCLSALSDITAAALATGACIVGILCLPLILLLVYKQRQVASNRRAQELVRMDSSNIQGLENPGYEVSPPAQGMPETKPRPPLTYVAQRQLSESGRHLLSEPNTPLSPQGLGDVFFPSLGEWSPTLTALLSLGPAGNQPPSPWGWGDPVPDSPNSEVS
ncbi:V-type immunoglobulin domain-containing suppressor of T-cell activation [Galemys pyrenaicus]|nr:V-type immunoglobulin domain-containing suppressor of T-cell activation [Galemys pyrenaicus]